MKSLTKTWPEATAFFDSVIGLHDSTIEEVQVALDQKRCVLVLGEVSRHASEGGFALAYESLHVEMLGCSFSGPQSISHYLGHDIVDAELSPGSLWIKSSAGSLSFTFDSLSFQLPA
jgi:hypothetical protein